MTHLDTSAAVKALMPHAVPINSHEGSQKHWRGQKRVLALELCHEGRQVVNSLRIHKDYFEKLPSRELIKIKQQLKSNGLDPDGNIYVSPCNQEEGDEQVTSKRCHSIFAATCDAQWKVRVGVVFDESNGIDGLDLGWYMAKNYTARAGHYLVLEHMPDEDFNVFPKTVRIGHPTVVTISDGTTMVTNSTHEARVAALFDALHIPFVDETKLSPVLLPDGSSYQIDYKIYPMDVEREAYVELKPFFPTVTEIHKAAEVHRVTGVTVYIMWGNTMRSGIGLESDKWKKVDGRRTMCSEYNEGLRAAKIYTTDSGEISFEEGYHLMANDKVGGTEWEEVERTTDKDIEVYANKLLASKLDRRYKNGKPLHICKKQRVSLGMRSVLRNTTRVEAASGRVFRPTDTFKPHFFRYKPFEYNVPSTHEYPGYADWNSKTMLDAYSVAQTSVAPRRNA